MMKIPLGLFAKLLLKFEAEQAVKDQLIADLLVKVAELEQAQQSDSAAAAKLSEEAKDTTAKLQAAIPGAT